MLLPFRKPRGGSKVPRLSDPSASIEALLDSCRSHRSFVLRERLRLRASITRLKRLTRRMIRTQRGLGASLRQLREIDRRAFRSRPSI